MKIELKNIQSIKHAVYELPETGIVQIKGGNSNGKSILFKAISAVVTLGIMNNAKRKALINKHSDSGDIFMQHHNKTLYVALYRDRNSCKVMYADGDNNIIRTFREGGIEKLIEAFGFSCYNKNSVCLQLYETFGPMPFVNTSDDVNGEIVTSVTEDSVAKKFIESYKTYTHPKATEYVKVLNKQIEQLERSKRNIVMYDWKKYEEMQKNISKHYEILKLAKLMQLEKVNVVPKLLNVDIAELQLEKVNIVPKKALIDIKPLILSKPKVVYKPVELHLDKPTDLVHKMEQLLKGVCPTCGRQLVDK